MRQLMTKPAPMTLAELLVVDVVVVVAAIITWLQGVRQCPVRQFPVLHCPFRHCPVLQCPPLLPVVRFCPFVQSCDVQSRNFSALANRTHARTDGRTDGRMDGQPENIMPYVASESELGDLLLIMMMIIFYMFMLSVQHEPNEVTL